jgi:hypothetical protein
MDNLRTYAMRLLSWLRGQDAERHRQQEAHEQAMANGVMRQHQDPDALLHRQTMLEQSLPSRPSGQMARPADVRKAAPTFDAKAVALQRQLEAEARERQLREQQSRHQGRGR